MELGPFARKIEVLLPAGQALQYVIAGPDPDGSGEAPADPGRWHPMKREKLVINQLLLEKLDGRD